MPKLSRFDYTSYSRMQDHLTSINSQIKFYSEERNAAELKEWTDLRSELVQVMDDEERAEIEEQESQRLPRDRSRHD
jgi:hypothetical protein